MEKKKLVGGLPKIILSFDDKGKLKERKRNWTEIYFQLYHFFYLNIN